MCLHFLHKQKFLNYEIKLGVFRFKILKCTKCGKKHKRFVGEFPRV